MSEIKLSCPGCHQHLKLPEEYIGQTLPCPACAAEATGPADSSCPMMGGNAQNTGNVSK